MRFFQMAEALYSLRNRYLQLQYQESFEQTGDLKGAGFGSQTRKRPPKGGLFRV
jgi:hypothetical protein